jgi:hypothetical protein
MDFCPAFPCSHFISFDERQIDHSFLISHVSGPLDEHISFDIAQAGITILVRTFFFCVQDWRGEKSETGEKND